MRPDETWGSVTRIFYLASGMAALALGGIGVVLPLIPTVPLFILAAFCFARSNPALERWLVNHPRYGAAIRLWRERGAISAAGKRAAFFAFAATMALSLFFVSYPWSLAPLLPIAIVGAWIWTRPEQ